LVLLICCGLNLIAGWQDRAGATDLIDYRLAPGDQINVTVFGQADLSGDFIIDGGGYVHMPLVGAVPVAALTLQECQQRIIARLGSGLIKRPVVSVRISEFRPVYVLGDVRTPGVYPFRFGLRASAAISLAGGLSTEQFGQLPDKAELLTAAERVETLSAARNAALIRLSRIEAERAEKKTVTPPSLENGEAANAAVAALIQNEQLHLAAAGKAHEEAIKLLQLQRPRLQEQMEAIREEIKATKLQLESTRSFLKAYEKLSGAGYGRGLTQFEFQRQEGQQEATIHRLRADISRLDVTIGDLDIRIQETQRMREMRLMTELRESQTRLQELDVALGSARKMLQLRRAQNGLAPSAMDAAPSEYDIRVAPPIRKVNEMMRLTFIPIRLAVGRSCATARMAFPIFVPLTRKFKPTSMITVTAIRRIVLF
jgi:polysaccharide export outer membrane protein